MDSSKTEVLANSSLMKKTKQQLVEIILRKDEVERNLRTQLKETVEVVDMLESDLDKKIREYDELEKDYTNECDEHVTDLIDKDNDIKCANAWFYLMLVAFCISTFIALIK